MSSRRPGAACLLGLAVALGAATSRMLDMPGSSHESQLTEPTSGQRALAARLERDVRALADEIGPRNMLDPPTMAAAADWIEAALRRAGYTPERQRYELTHAPFEGRSAENLIAELRGTERPGEIVVIGAHYDTVPGAPGANDNASSVAVLVSLAAWFRERPRPRTLRFIAFANEEPPFYLGRDMGSHVYAQRSREREERIEAMMAMDGLGYFDDEPSSQRYPLPGIRWFYPDRARFIGFVTRLRDARLLRRAVSAFRAEATIPSEAAALPGFLPGVGWSDHWSFWQHGYPAFLVTDTLPLRDPCYHTPGDTAERLDYERMARVAEGLRGVVSRIAE